MYRRKFSLFKFAGVFSITTLIFLIGIILGNYLSSYKLMEINSIQDDLRMDTMALEVQSLILNKNPCEISQIGTISDELYNLAAKLTFMESQFGAGDPSVRRLKNYYSILELRHWILFTEANQKCGLNNDLILYFYSNELDCEDCEKQGFVLDYLHKIRPDVKIYSFEYSLDNPALNTIKSLYKIKSSYLPAIVIGDDLYTGFIDKAEIESILS